MNAVIAVMPVMPSADAEDRGEDRQAGGDERAEGEEQDEQRDARCRSARRCRRASPGSAMPEPLASTVRPASRAWSMVSVSASMVAGLTSATVSTSKCEVMVPTRPSSDSGESAWALAFASDGGVPLCSAASSDLLRCVAARPRPGWRAGRRRPSAGGRRGRRPGRRRPSCTSARRACGPSGAATTTLTDGLVEGVGGAGEELGLEVGGLLRRDARDRERVAHRLGQVAATVTTAMSSDQPAGDEERPAPVGGLAEAVEQGGHGWVSWVCGGGWCGSGSGEEVAGGRGAGRRTPRRAVAVVGVVERARRGQRRTGRASRRRSSRARAGVEGGALALERRSAANSSAIDLEPLVGGGEQPRVGGAGPGGRARPSRGRAAWRRARSGRARRGRRPGCRAGRRRRNVASAAVRRSRGARRGRRRPCSGSS